MFADTARVTNVRIIIIIICRAISSQIRHISTIGKNLLSSNIASRCVYHMVKFGPLSAEIALVVWGTPANFNRFWQRYCTVLQKWASAKLCGVEERAPPLAVCLPMSLTLVCCGQAAGWIKMPFGAEVGLGPGDIVLDGGSASPTERGTAALTFRSMSTVAKKSPISATAELLFFVT